MLTSTMLDDRETRQLRESKYNARVAERIDVHGDLMILRVAPDEGMTSFAPGQYSVMGLGNWEPRVPGCQDEQLDDHDVRRVLKRAYSFSCSILDDSGKVRSPADFPYFEFYVVLVRNGEDHPPGLTPRLFALSAGDRLFVGPKATGHYTLDGVKPDDNVILVATGTGEAPHNAMVAQFLSHGHRGKIAAVTCVRRRADLGYLATHRQLESHFDNYRYLTLTTREPENLDPAHSGYVGKRYLQDYMAGGDFERDSGVPLDPGRTHVFLCGNPAMIGAPKVDGRGAPQWPSPVGMIELLERRGFHRDERGAPGNVHFEKYW